MFGVAVNPPAQGSTKVGAIGTALHCAVISAKAVGNLVSLITIIAVVTLVQIPLVKLYVTVWLPATLLVKSISPVIELMLTPASEEYVPPVIPDCVTIALPRVQ